MSNSIHSTTVSPAGVVSGRSGTTPRWNKWVQFLTPCRRLWHLQPPLQSWPTSLISDSISSQPVAPIIKSNPFISQSNPSVHPLSTNIINTLYHLSNTLERPPIAPPVKIHVPDVFDRTDPHQLHHFLFQCRLYFHSGPAVFKSDYDKINFTMTYVSGMVQDCKGTPHTWLRSPLPPNIISLCSPWLPKNGMQGHFSIYIVDYSLQEFHLILWGISWRWVVTYSIA